MVNSNTNLLDIDTENCLICLDNTSPLYSTKTTTMVQHNNKHYLYYSDGPITCKDYFYQIYSYNTVLYKTRCECDVLIHELCMNSWMNKNTICPICLESMYSYNFVKTSYNHLKYFCRKSAIIVFFSCVRICVLSGYIFGLYFTVSLLVILLKRVD